MIYRPQTKWFHILMAWDIRINMQFKYGNKYGLSG